MPDWSEPFDGDEDASLAAMVVRLAELDGLVDAAGLWVEDLWKVLEDGGASRWTLSALTGKSKVDRPSLLTRYARLAEGSLTAVFILTQHDAAVRRMAAHAGRGRASDWLGRIEEGRAFATVGISQLTTSKRHGGRALRASRMAYGGYRLDGVMPWVTAASRADVIVTGAVLDDNAQLLIALPTDRSGLTVQPAFELAALQGSSTCEVLCVDVAVQEEDVLSDPTADVLAAGGSTGTGGLETSALALGQSRAALRALRDLAPRREDLAEPLEALADSWRRTALAFLAAAEGRTDAPSPAQVRGEANGLALRTTQAFLTARKGSGFLRGEPAERWARQALFFLVWSCPAPVAQAALRELAGLCPA